VLDKPEGVGGESLLAAMQDTRFPEVSHRLQRGVHIGPEDGMLMDFLDNHFATLRDFLALWGGTLVRSGEGYIHLVPGDRYHGAAQLGRHDMLVGMALAHMRTDPTLIGRGSSFDEIANRIERACGGAEEYLRVMVNRRRQSTVSGQREKAVESIGKSLRRLDSLGFCDIEDDIVRGNIVYPRAAAMRFAEPARHAGGDEAQLTKVINHLKAQPKERAEGQLPLDLDGNEGDFS
jgi:chromosome condensin MukBEF MukE localization factor